MSIVYLDNAATTPLAPEAREALLPWLDGTCFGNPSSRHKLGVRAAEAVDEARSRVAAAIGARASEVTFTSGGTEANNLALFGGARARKRHGRHIVIGPTEHSCVTRAAAALVEEGFEVEHARLTGTGALDLEHLAGILREDTVLVAQMLANNEFGTVYPVRRLARTIRSRSPHALLHVDAVQAFGKLELSLIGLGADSLSISSHKVHGPQGVGALVRAPGVVLKPLLVGGGQEDGQRSGTENVAAIVGFGRAAQLAAERLDELRARAGACRDRLVAGLTALDGACVLEPGAPEHPLLPTIVAARIDGAPSEVTMHHLEARDVITSAGSACQSKKKAVSPGLLAIGLTPEDARRVLRFSFGWTTTEDDIDRALAALAEVTRELAGARP